MNYYGLLVFTIVLTSVAQIVLKTGVTSKKSLQGALLNWRTFTAYSILGLVTIVNHFVLVGMDLKTLGALSSASYVLVIVLAWLLLREKQDPWSLLGAALVCVGVALFHLSS